MGWQERTPSILTLDLGTVKPIRGVSFSTAAGFADVRWPLTIRILQKGIRTRLIREFQALRETAEEEGVPARTRSDVLIYSGNRIGREPVDPMACLVSINIEYIA